MNKNSSVVCQFLFGIGVFCLTLGCSASAITHKSISPETLVVVGKHQRTINIVASGGREFDEVSRPWVSNEEFSRAVEETILKFGVFSGVLRGTGADYLLETGIFSIDQPYGGLDMTVKMEVAWILRRMNSGEVVWRKAIKSEVTKTVGDAFVGGTRIKMATEGAIRENISVGVSELSKVKLN